MSPLDWASALLLLVGAVFFLSGTVGMLRFPDTLSRLHALTKADNVGLGLVVAGLVLQADAPLVVVKLVLVWLLALAASSTACQLVARTAVTPASDDDGR